jgi:hypothetical protein
VVAMVPSGGYAEYPAVPLATTFPVPEGVDDGAPWRFSCRASRPDGGRPDLRSVPRCPRAVRPPRDLRDREPRAERGAERGADEEEPRRRRFWLVHCVGRRDMMEAPLRDLFERAVRGELVPQIGATYRSARSAAPTRTSRAGPRAASSCWTRVPSRRAWKEGGGRHPIRARRYERSSRACGARPRRPARCRLSRSRSRTVCRGPGARAR